MKILEATKLLMMDNAHSTPGAHDSHDNHVATGGSLHRLNNLREEMQENKKALNEEKEIKETQNEFKGQLNGGGESQDQPQRGNDPHVPVTGIAPHVPPLTGRGGEGGGGGGGTGIAPHVPLTRASSWSPKKHHEELTPNANWSSNSHSEVT